MKKLLYLVPLCGILLNGCAAPLVQGGPGPTVSITTPPPPIPAPTTFYSASDLVYQCQQAWQNGNLELAISKCREATETNPNYAPAYEKLAEIYLSINDKNQAIQMYLKSAGIYRLEGRCEEPRTLYYKILGLYPNYSDATIGLKEVERKNCGLGMSNTSNSVTKNRKIEKKSSVIRRDSNTAIIVKPLKKSKFPPATGGGKALKESEW